MYNLSDSKTVQKVLEKHGFHFSKSLGQNFLINPTVCPRMAEMGGAAPDVAALEVGPGIGVLTQELAKRCRKVVAIELDRRLFPVLEETLDDFSNVKIVPGDVLKIDLPQLFDEEFAGMDVIVCANLPYYITSPVIMRLLEEKLPIRSLTVMVQKEAAQRLCAQSGERACGAVSAAVRYYAEPRVLFPVSRGSFMPPPNVDSAVIRLTRHEKPPVEVGDEQLMFKLIRAAFNQRRKTLVNAVTNCGELDFSKEQVQKALETVGLSPTVRGEALYLDQFAKLTDALL